MFGFQYLRRKWKYTREGIAIALSTPSNKAIINELSFQQRKTKESLIKIEKLKQIIYSQKNINFDQNKQKNKMKSSLALTLLGLTLLMAGTIIVSNS